MAATILGILERIYPFLGERQAEFAARWQRLELSSGTVLLSEGEVSRRAFLIEKGCLRVWFINRGRDVTAQFFFENEGLSSIESFRTGSPSLFTIEAIEPSIVWALSKEDYDEVEREARKDVRTLEALLDAAYARQIHYMKLFRSFLRDRPQERYRRLVEEEPRIIQRVPQRYIASYLGITPESLSRIRARLAKSSSGAGDHS